MFRDLSKLLRLFDETKACLFETPNGWFYVPTADPEVQQLIEVCSNDAV